MVNRRLYKLLIPVVLLASAILAVVLIITEASDQMNRQSDRLYSAFISATIEHEAEALGQQALDYAWWDEAVQKLVVDQDPQWADANIGSYLYDNFGVSVSLVMSQDNRYILGFVDGKLQKKLDLFTDNPTLEHLISQVRRSSLDAPEAASGMILFDQQLYMAGVFPFSPESPDAIIRDGVYRSVLVLLQRMDMAFIQQHAQHFALQLGSLDLKRQTAGLTLASPVGEPLATLNYQYPRPGTDLLERIMAPLLGLLFIFVLIFLLSVLVISKVTSLNRRVEQEKQALEQVNLALANEVSQHRLAQQQLRLNHEVFKSTSEAVVITDSDGTILDVNQAYCQLTGFSRDQVLGQNPNIHKSGRHDARFYHEMWLELDKNGHWRGEIWDRRQNGEIYPKWLSISEVRDEQGQVSHYVGVFSDITERKNQEARLEHLALYDPLTRLPNRRLFQERVEQKLLKAQRYPEAKGALLFIDLDHFKHVNDSLGHAIGDQLLLEVAQRFNQCMRSSDAVGRNGGNSGDNQHIVARMGGDEFTIAVDGLQSRETITVIIERLHNALDRPVVLDGQEVFVSASIGVSLYPDDGDSYEQLVGNADKAMYRSKRGGRNQFNFFSAEMDSIANRRIELEAALRKAISEQRFILHYQPKVNADTGAVSSIEALIRWEHPDKGLIPPADFIQIAEDTGLIIPIGEWVIATATKQVKAWSQALAVNLKVAVNLSAKQFMDPALLEKVLLMLQHSDLPPQQLELEVTETVMIDDIDSAIRTLTRLRQAGIRVAIDDFGTGYSSLSYLRKLPLDTLKIDRSFTAEINQDSKMAAIVEGVIRMGHRLELEVVAEGVETHAQKDLLSHYGCNCQQGFLFSKPLEACHLEAFLRQANNTANSACPQSFDPKI